MADVPPILTCDPGLGGAFCFYDAKSGRMEVEAMPTFTKRVGKAKKRRVLDEHAVFDCVGRWKAQGAVHLYIEAVGGMPGQSAPAAFNFGSGYGAVRMAAIAHGLAVEAIPPATWKAALRVPSNKHGARQRASEMIPTHRQLWPKATDDGKAEAALLALYAYRHLNGGAFVHRSRKDRKDIDGAANSRVNAAFRKRERAEATKARLAVIGSSDDPELATSLF